jgi:hypothetical protein
VWSSRDRATFGNHLVDGHFAEALASVGGLELLHLGLLHWHQLREHLFERLVEEERVKLQNLRERALFKTRPRKTFDKGPYSQEEECRANITKMYLL